jgi:putative transposase
MRRQFKTYRYELDPNAAQAAALARAAGARRFVFNWALETWRRHYAVTGTSPTRAQLCRELTALRHSPGHEWMLDISSKIMQQTVIDVWRAYQNFFAGRARYPKFKAKKRDRARFRFAGHVRISGSRILVPRIGWVRLRLSRMVEGRPKSVTVKRCADRWFVLVLSEFDLADRPASPIDPGRVVGIDVGLRRLCTLSDGLTVAPPRFARRDSARVRRATRSLHRKRLGSRSRQKQRRRLARLHARIAARRKDFIHKLTSALSSSYEGFCVETFDARGLARTKLSKSVLDAGLGELLRQLEYKADWQGKAVVAVGRFYPSTKKCGRCGEVNAALARGATTWRCVCGAVHDRDLNAARNIRAEGLRLLVAAGHADTGNACGAHVRPHREATDAEAGTPTMEMPNRFDPVPPDTGDVDFPRFPFDSHV